MGQVIPSAAPPTGGRVQEIRMFFIFIDFQRQEPAPYRDCRGSLRHDAGAKLRQEMDGSPPPRAPPRHATSGHSHAGTGAVAQRRPLARDDARLAERPPTPFERRMPPRRRGRIPETSGESIFQRIALTRTFYARRRRRRSRHTGLPPDSSATALKTAPTTL